MGPAPAGYAESNGGCVEEQEETSILQKNAGSEITRQLQSYSHNALLSSEKRREGEVKGEKPEYKKNESMLYLFHCVRRCE
jgi:hypothetical protein